MSPTISVIMSVYNHEKTVSRAINSILNQSYKNYEFIIIDDGSTDNSKKIITNLAKKNKRIKFYIFKKNKGLPKCLNFGIKKSRGTYIARMDADDFSIKNRLKIQKNFLDKNPKYSIIGSNAEYRDKYGKIVKKTNLSQKNDEIKFVIFMRNPIIHSSVFVRKIFFKNNLYNEKFIKCQDYELWIRSIDKFNFKNLKNNLISRYEYENFNIKSLYFSILARSINLKIYKLHLVIFGSFLDIINYFKLILKKVFL